MSEWKEYKLGELYDFSSGLSKAREFFGKGFGFVSFKDVFYNYFIPDQLTEMVLSTPKEQISCSVKKGDVFLTRTSETMEDLGMSTVALKNYPSATFNGFTKRLRPKDPYLISPTFAGYYFRSPLFRAKVTSYAIMTTRASLNNEILSRLTISLPPIEIQDSIGEVLKSLDDKIELNNKINQELETLAQTLFKRWFIDFEFPNKNGEPYKSSGGEMVESELGEIPKGWRVNKLNEVADCFDNKRIPLSSMERSIRKGDYPYYGAASLMDYIDDYLFDGIYLLMGEDGSVTDINGYPILQYVFGKFWVNNHAHVLKGRIISTELVMCLLRNTNIGDLVTGAVQPKLNQGNMNKISIPLPEDLKTITTIENLITEYYNLVRNNILEINELTNLRDTLLPKLISGELEINEISN